MSITVINKLSIFAFTCSLISCVNVNDQKLTDQLNIQQVKYKVSIEDIQNPGRGFYYPFATKSSNFKPVTTEKLSKLRNTYTVPVGGNYTIRHTLFLRQYILDSYVDKKTLSAVFLKQLETDFVAARDAGVKFLVRFSYNNTPPKGDCGSWICAPYGDANKEVVLAHIEQVSKVIRENSDVVLSWQAGFIGTWGEMMFTDHWGDFDTQGVIYDKDWENRIDLVKALLDATPKEMMIQVRKPQLIQKFAHGASAPVTVKPLSIEQAFDGSDVSRVGLYNDCFLATEDDWGTFADYGSSDHPPVNNPKIIKTLKDHQSQNSRYTLVGGETCHDEAYSPQNDCSNDVVGTIDRFNYTYLNSVYNNLVNNDWETEGCMTDIKRRLGYRLEMTKGSFTKQVKTKGDINIQIELNNSGFTAPMFPMEINLVLKNKKSGQEIKIALDKTKYDIRHWSPEKNIKINEVLTLPKNATKGEYDLFLHLSDISNNGIISQRPEYSIQFANKNSWHAEKGYNDLQHVLNIIGG